MNNGVYGIAVITVAATLAACGMESSNGSAPPATTAPKPEPTSLEGSTCAVIPTDVEFGNWQHRSKMHNCLRELAYEDWTRARADAAHIATWGIGGPNLSELVDVLTRFESADAVRAALDAAGLLDGKGEPDILEYYDEGWQPLTTTDWLLTSGRRYSFDAETGMHPNQHDALLYDLADLFGDALADAKFAETAPHWDSEEPYQLHASLGDREWNRQAENFGDWYDIGAVLDLLNDMAADIGVPDRIMPLQTFDQIAIVVVGPGESLVAAAADGLIKSTDAAEGMERGKAFEEEVLRRYRLKGN